MYCMVPQDLGREEVARRYLDREEELSYRFAVCMEVHLQHNIRQAVLGGFWRDLERLCWTPGPDGGRRSRRVLSFQCFEVGEWGFAQPGPLVPLVWCPVMSLATPVNGP